ncbi:DEAD/DEAH box helicase family protein [Brumimicrobium mesophilum]|uniref:DEAD/DEAH box helicase family protein n=1 Tax=Brumimicrobium mesophilum TaxID=392717 RepID=UPI000D140026|nr:DEAD/DEAH box helicase family protein [Brumimicrobium mesophilum]
MKEYPKDIKFKYSWRKYQERVLTELDEHLLDKHLHIIAPPGSGKTILGLEVAIRLNKPTLILAPTLAIRNQWIHRLCELFLQTQTTPDWISRDIRNPKFLTVVTYQGLHSACNNLRNTEENLDEEESEIPHSKIEESLNVKFDEIVKGLQGQKIQTIVVDEAHHLKNEWWKTLTRVKEKLNPIVVGLTATPPYDVTPNEWQRYIELNGPVDAEISVPELVIEGDLCAHQDYVYFTLPSEEENKKILKFRENIEKTFQELKNEETLIKAIENHPIWRNPENKLDWIYSNLSYYSALIIFLNHNEKEIPLSHLDIIGDKKFKIPPLDYKWMESILDFFLYKEKDHFIKYEEYKFKLENKLRRVGAIEKRRIDFSNNQRITGFLTSSISKLNGICKIVDFEYNQLGVGLRMVILTDYIRKEFYVNSVENNIELTKIGIIPIFEKLRRNNTNNKKIGVLTGSMIIIPKSAYSTFESLFNARGITKINSSPVPYDNNYILIHQNEQIKNSIIHIVTQIFQGGEIEVLIGTKSLLGEGWDAPAINSLILASFVGSFVLSNQMRGRAIRTQKGNPAKTGNIWHLATLDQTSVNGGQDLELLSRRFRSFVGVSFKEDAGIENGIGRLNLANKLNNREEIEVKNKNMFALAGDREDLKNRWNLALETGITLVEEIKIPFNEKGDYKATKSMYLNKTIANLLISLGFGLLAYGVEALQGFGRAARGIKSMRELYFFLIVVGILGIVLFGRLAFKTFRLFVKYRDISKDIQNIGKALIQSLLKVGLVHTKSSDLKVKSKVDEWGSVYCHLEGGTTFEKSTFINSLYEIIAPIDNPRYVITRKSKLLLFISQKDYHSVPEILGKNKAMAENFEDNWNKHVGNCDLIFTRTLEGRKALLKSRMKSLAAQFEEKIEHVNKWER